MENTQPAPSGAATPPDATQRVICLIRRDEPGWPFGEAATLKGIIVFMLDLLNGVPEEEKGDAICSVIGARFVRIAYLRPGSEAEQVVSLVGWNDPDWPFYQGASLRSVFLWLLDKLSDIPDESQETALCVLTDALVLRVTCPLRGPDAQLERVKAILRQIDRSMGLGSP